MCLTVHADSNELIADEDIICYKHLRYYKYNGITHYSGFYFQEYVYILGKTYKDSKAFADMESDKSPFHNKFKNINRAYHAYTTLVSIPSHSAVVKCIIPKGSIYYKHGNEIASNKIKITKQILYCRLSKHVYNGKGEILYDGKRFVPDWFSILSQIRKEINTPQ